MLTSFGQFRHPNTQRAAHVLTSSICSDTQIFNRLIISPHFPRSVLTSKYSTCSSCAHLLRPVLTSKYSTYTSRALHLRSVLTPSSVSSDIQIFNMHAVHVLTPSSVCSDTFLVSSEIQMPNIQFMCSPSSVSSDIQILNVQRMRSPPSVSSDIQILNVQRMCSPLPSVLTPKYSTD